MTTTIDFTPLFRSSIGFDRMLDALKTANRIETLDKWPPYDIVKLGEDRYRIDMAVAGFAENDLSITQENTLLIVSGRKDDREEGREYLYRGLAGRAFERRFELADHVRVEGARLRDGLLVIELRREIPEELKPRRIAIRAATSAAPEESPRQIAADRDGANEPAQIAAAAKDGAKDGAEGAAQNGTETREPGSARAA